MSVIRKYTKDFLVEPRPSLKDIDKNKPWKECWCVAKWAEGQAISGYMTSPYHEPIDVLLETDAEAICFQVSEIKEECPRGQTKDMVTQQYLGQTLITPSNDVFLDRFQKTFDKKNINKYGDVSEIDLLFYSNIYFASSNLNDPDCGIDISLLKEIVSNSKFRKIWILFDSEDIVQIK